MAQWDFAADIADLLDRTNLGGGPRSMSEMIEAARPWSESDGHTRPSCSGG